MQQLNPSEISEIIKGRIEKLDVASQARNEGTIVSVSDGIVRIYGLADAMYGEMIEFPAALRYGAEPGRIPWVPWSWVNTRASPKA